MIAHLRGRLHAAGPDQVVVDVGGVGYRAYVPASTRSRLPATGREVFLYTSLQVREESLTLYGFLDPAELELFEALIGVSGIGPKVALAILSAASPEELRRAIALGDVAFLTRLPHVGKKTAQRLVLELKEKLGGVAGAARGQPGAAAAPGAAPADPVLQAWSEAMEALVSLGYSRAEASEALEQVRPGVPPGADTAELVRAALRWLGAARSR
ncbi:MAG: Holliday junction branch migration protein RuvA [Bacillota bacterium]|nr:MAG: Holliday junction branch migration protein RuvA [Bacillota bacterium]